jgi:hypothetical protein
MKVNVTGVCEVKATKVVPSSEIIRLVRPIAGKKASVDVNADAKVSDLIAATRTAIGIPPATTFAEVVVKRGGVVLNASKTFSELGVHEEAKVDVCFKYVL